MTARLSVHNVSVTFGLPSGSVLGALSGRGRISAGGKQGPIGVQALHGMTFEAKMGDRIALIGRNGAGKSTLLRTLAGIYPPTSGHVEAAGRMGVMFQPGLGIVKEATGYDNIKLAGLFQGLMPDEIKAATPSIIEFCDLGDFLHLPVSTYSTGMRMRLTFAILTATSPEILLVDEMIGVGDKAFINRSIGRRNDFLSNANILVLASHARRLIEETCNRAIWVEEGRIVDDGPVDTVLKSYFGRDDGGAERAA